MTFAAYEGSVESGQPIELYTFSLGSDTYRFASCEDDYTYLFNTYSASEVSRSPVLVGPEARSSAVTVELPSNNLLARRYINIVPGQRASLTIIRVHRNDPDQEGQIFFKGLVKTVGFDLLGVKARIIVLPLSEALNRSAPRFVFSSACNHVLYDSRCKVSSTSFRFSGTVSSVSGSEITVPGLNANGDGWATGGYITINGTDFRTIVAHTGDVVTVMQPFPSGSPSIGASVEVFAGCGRSLEICDSKFSNVANFGGHRFVPLRNLFSKGLT